MCANCDYNILNEVYAALEPLFNEYGQDAVIKTIHDHFHYKHIEKNVAQVTLWERWDEVGE